ncbi:MAG: hypothetical protein HOE11_03875 [Candidatus Diapherotrites archaeon]|jgi:hypothetical protein|nr:hypothetical protein [Candidatus Diapherotrites archaeon]MBT4597237.1 hypothetical protein [Candidatus Diapherotrites archaeon]
MGCVHKAFIFFLILFFASTVFSSQLMALHGKASSGGALILAGDLKIEIFDSANGGTLIYSSGNDFNSEIVDGYFDVVLGELTPLDLNYGQLYYFDILVNGNDLNFGSSDRQKFQASQGVITEQGVGVSAITQTKIADSSINNQKIAVDAQIDWNKISKQTALISDLNYSLLYDVFLRQIDANTYFVLQTDGNVWYYSKEDANEIFVKQVDGNEWYPRKALPETIVADWTFSGNNIFSGETKFNGGFGEGGTTINNGTLYTQSLVIVSDINAYTINGIDINGTFVPSLNNEFDLGSADSMWRTVYGVDANFQSISVPANSISWGMIESPGTNAISWTSIDKTGSSLSDLASYSHNSLESLQGGTTSEYFHLTSAQHTNFSLLSGTWGEIQTNDGSISPASFNSTLNLLGGSGINVRINGSAITIDYNGSAGVDTNCAVSHSCSNILYVGDVSTSLDTNAQTACADTEYLRGDGTCQTITSGSGTDTNWQNSPPQDGEELIFGIDNNYNIKWDGSNAVHTITTGDFVFTGGNVGIGTATPSVGFEVGSDVLGLNAKISSTLSAEIAPALTTGNWTLGTGWTFDTSPDLLNKSGEGGTTNGGYVTALSGAPTVGVTYKIVYTVDKDDTKESWFTFGGLESTRVTVDGTYTEYMTAISTDVLAFTNYWNSARYRITDVTIKALTSGTGDLLVEGDLSVASNLKLGNSIQSLSGTDLIYFTAAGNVGIGVTPDAGKKLHVDGSVKIRNDAHLYLGGAGGSIYHNNTQRLSWYGGGHKTIFHTYNVSLDSDNQKLYLGAGDDASITYDGTNLLINPKEIGSGNVTINSDLTIEGLTSSGGGSAGHVTCWKADGITIGYCSDAPDASGICTCN